MTMKFRYRLGLIGPYFKIDPRVPLRALTSSELDELASMLRSSTAALQGLDGELGDRLDQIEHLENPWWSELRPEMLRRGYTPQNLDDNFGGCALGDFTLRLTEKPGVQQDPPRWWAPLLANIVSRVDPEPLTAAVAENIRVLAKIDVARLDTSLEAICLFHPLGAPRQVEITNLRELWGMRPKPMTVRWSAATARTVRSGKCRGRARR